MLCFTHRKQQKW